MYKICWEIIIIKVGYDKWKYFEDNEFYHFLKRETTKATKFFQKFKINQKDTGNFKLHQMNCENVTKKQETEVFT